jgi:hypothetical protein
MTGAQLAAPYYTRAHASAIETGKVAASLPALHHFAQRLGARLRDLIPSDC